MLLLYAAIPKRVDFIFEFWISVRIFVTYYILIKYFAILSASIRCPSSFGMKSIRTKFFFNNRQTWLNSAFPRKDRIQEWRSILPFSFIASTYCASFRHLVVLHLPYGAVSEIQSVSRDIC